MDNCPKYTRKILEKWDSLWDSQSLYFSQRGMLFTYGRPDGLQCCAHGGCIGSQVINQFISNKNKLNI